MTSVGLELNMIKKQAVKIILFLGILISTFGMHQANMAKNVSKIIFQAAHTHNWFWADGWVSLLMEMILQSSGKMEEPYSESLIISFQSSKRMTECFSSIREAKGGLDENRIVQNIVNVFRTSEKQAKEIVWISKCYTGLFPEIELMRQNTDMGTKHSQNVIDLITEKRWAAAGNELVTQYQSMRHEEREYSERSFIIAERADRIYFISFGTFCLFVFLFSFYCIRHSHKILISKRKKVEGSLQKSEEKYRAIFDSSTEGILVARKGKIAFANPALKKMTGYSTEFFTSTLFTEFIHPDDREMFFNRYKNTLSEENVETGYQFRLLTASGEKRWININSSVLKWEGALSTLSFITDITERKKAEEDRGRLISAIEQVAETIVITDLRGSIQYVNPAFETVSGYGNEEVYRQNPRILKSGRQDDAFYNNLWETITSGETWQGQMVNKRKNGSFYTEEATISPVLDGAGKITSFVAVKRDITSEMDLKNRLAQAQKMESIGTLAGGIAHDFNNILFPIVGHTQMLIEDIPQDSPFQKNLNEIYAGALRASELVKQILTFAHQDSGELKLMKMQPIIKEALKLIRSSIPTTIEIKQNIRADCGIIKADPTQIHQVIMNLTTNAYHAMEETGGVLTVSLKEIEFKGLDLIKPELIPGVYACLTVADTGKGMNKELTQKIFDPFFTTKKAGKGTGMGLSVVHGIVKSMDGAIHVCSEPGKGTEFLVYLPIAEARKKQPATKVEASIQGGTEHILLVDDEKAIIGMEQNILERIGYKVTSSTSSIEALEAFRATPEKFDMVITDMAMPNMPGDSLAGELTKIRPEIPILLCTGFSETMSEEQAASLGIKGFLLKPVVMRDLSHKIREVLDKNEKI